MARVLDALNRFFEDDDWKIDPVEGHNAVRMAFSGDAGKWACFAQAREDQEQMVFYSVFPVNVPEEHRTEVALFLTRANYGMILGNFEIDLRDGEVRYKTATDCEANAEIEPAMIKPHVYANVLTMDRYYGALQAVAAGEKDAAAAIQEVEEG